jgi:hypothetical protein
MKLNRLRLQRALVCFAIFFGVIGGYWGQTFTDIATNLAYSSGWNNASNGGSGFQTWSLSSDGVNAGRFIGDPSNASYGMSSTGIGSSAFGLYGHSSQYSYAIRYFTSSLAVGDILSFHWSMNYDCGSSGSKGWELRSGTTNIFGVSNTNSATISYNGVSTGTVSTNYGTSAMLVSIQRINISQYSVSITRRNSSDGTFSTTINSASAIDNIRIYIGSQETNAGQRNIFFNNFQIQKPDQYRSKTSGDWSSAATWEISTDGGSNWSNASSAPGSTLYSTITIKNGHTISQNQNYTAGSNNNIVVESGGILNMTGSSGNFQFNSLSVSGNLVRNNSSYVYSGAITVNNGGKYTHAVDGGSIPTCTWNSGSTFEVTGVAVQQSFSSGAIQNYHHILWNCPSQSSTFSFGGLSTVNGNLTVQSTGATPSSSSCLLLTNSSTLASTISGNLSIAGGYFAPFGSSTTGNCSLAIGGDFSLSTGTFDIFRQASNAGTINLSGNFTMTSGTLTKAGAGAGNFNFAKSGTQTYSKSGGTISTVINFTVNNGSTLDVGTSLFDGSTSTFTLSSGGGLITANTSGISSTGATGSIQVGGLRTFNTGANYTFNGSSAQVTGNGFTGAANLTINNSSGVTLTSNASLSGILTLTNGVLTVGSMNIITVYSGGSINVTSGSLASGTGAGTFTFSGTGTISGTIGFNNVTIAGGVNFGSASTINGTLTINTGGYVNTNAPSYAVGSTLKYNTGNASAYGRSTEWSSLSGAGYPHHVQISNNTTLNVNNATNVARQAAGNLTVDAGSTLSLEGMTIASPTVIGLTFGGNITNNGTITLATATERLKCVDYTNLPGAITTLSSNIGGDLEVTGSFVDNGTYNANARAIFFTGTGTQNISGSGTFDIDYMVMNKPSGEVVMLNDLKCEGPNGGNVITLTNNTDVLNLNGFDVIFGKSGVTSVATGSGKLKGHVNSDITILGTGSFGTLNFDNANNTIGALTLNRTTSGSFSLGSNLIVSGTLTLSDGYLSIGAYTLECQNAVSVSSGSLRGSSSSSLILSGGNSTAELKMDNTTPGTTNLLSALTLSKTGASSAVNISANVIVNGNLSISGNGTNTVNTSKQLTVNGVLNNNGGILALNSDATLVQGLSSTVTGTGTYNVKQTISGAGSGTPTGRYWYVGSPVSGATSAVYDAAGANVLKYYSEPANAWQEITDNTSALEVGRGYFVQATSGTSELNFTGGTINNGSYTLNVTRNTSTNAYRGYNLLTNPYPSYLDWDNVTRSNVGTTMWYRAANSGGTMVFDTYNVSAGTGTNNNGAGVVTNFIPPMQSFWVSVPQGQTSGTISFGNAQRSHYSTGVQGLRSSAQDFPAFLRLNLLDGNFVDQTILYMKPDANNTFDEYDSEKMFLGGVPQFYSTVNAKKLVLNGMKNQKARTSVPLTMELPTSKSYTFQADEFNIEDGLILLEDKQEGIIQDLTINPTYSFFANAGTNATRFVVHFQLASAPVLVGGPQELENLGMDQLSTDNIQITSNNQGTVIIRLDEGFKPEGSIRIFDASGRLVEQRDFNDQETTIQLNEQAGMYFVEVSAGKLMVKKKIVIN